MAFEDELDALALFIAVCVLSVLTLLCCHRLCCRAPSNKHRATSEDRRRTMGTAKGRAFVAACVAPTAHLVDSVERRSYYRLNSRGMSLHCVEHWPKGAAVVGGDFHAASRDAGAGAHSSSSSAGAGGVSGEAKDSAGSAPPSGDAKADTDGLKGIVCYCHGYLDTVDMLATNTFRRLAASGYAVFCCEYEGHGLSDGYHGLVEDMRGNMVGDIVEYYDEVRARFPNQTPFLFGESLGGAVALQVGLRQPHVWRGAVLVAPMAKISPELMPAPFVVKMLVALSKYLPALPAVPTAEDLLDRAFHDPAIRELVKANPLVFEGKHLLATGKELLFLSLDCEKHLPDIRLPFLVLHSNDDVVTDPGISQTLVDSASSEDKTFKRYEGMWHALLVGESAANIDRVFNDVLGWLDARHVSSGAPGEHGTPMPDAGAAQAADVAVDVTGGASGALLDK